jgi:hypothetical protein
LVLINVPTGGGNLWAHHNQQNYLGNVKNVTASPHAAHAELIYRHGKAR